MSKFCFWAMYICLGIIAFKVRITLSEEDVVNYMTIINQIAGFATLIMILFNVIVHIRKKIKQEQKSMKRLKGILIFSVISIFVYWYGINKLYGKHPAEVLNDSITIITLTIALTTELYENILKTIFYKG